MGSKRNSVNEKKSNIFFRSLFILNLSIFFIKINAGKKFINQIKMAPFAGGITVPTNVK